MRSAILLLALAASACGASTQLETQSMPAAAAVTVPGELATQNPGLLRAWQGKDPAALHPYIADYAIITTDSGTYKGWEEIQSKWVAPSLSMISDFNATPTAFTHDGNDIVEYGKYSLKMSMNGQTQNVMGGYSHRWRKMSDGSWKVISANITQAR